MGIHFNEINPVGKLDRKQTQALAKDLWMATGQNPGLSPDLIEASLQKYKSQDDKLSIGSLNSAGWLDDPAVSARRGVVPGRYTLSDIAGAVAHATIAPRMTFDEACDQIKLVRDRLGAAPAAIEGITVNRVFLFGSTLRDNNSRDTIGDLDLSADFGFDARYKDMSYQGRAEKARTVWNAVIAQEDDRLQMGDAKSLAQNANDTPDRPFSILSIWQNPRASESSLSPDEQQRIDNLQERALAQHARTRKVAEMVSGEPKSKFLPPSAGPTTTPLSKNLPKNKSASLKP